MTVAAYPARTLTDDELRRYREDGVVMIADAIDPNWLALAERGVDEARRELSLTGWFMSRGAKGFAMDIFLWKRIDALRDLVYYGPFARWAQQLMGAREVRFFYDQMFVKEAGTDVPTPWHQDLSFWPIRGEQVCSFWVPFDRVDRESSGLLYVKGSHRWPQRFKAVSNDYSPILVDDDLDDVPDIHLEKDKHELLEWEMKPGDMLAFHPLTLHGSYGNASRTRARRALALRWAGDDVVYAPSPKRMPIHFKHDSLPGGPLRGAAFPRILPDFDPEERAARRAVEWPTWQELARSTANTAVATAKAKLVGTLVKKQTWKR